MGVVRQLVSNKTWGRNTRFKKYLMIADTEGFDRALEELELDWEFRTVPKPSYYRIRRKLLELKEKAEKMGLQSKDGTQRSYRDLFVEFLLLLVRGKVTKDDVTRELRISEDEWEGLKKWMKDKGLSEVVKLVMMGKKVQEMKKMRAR